MSAESPPHKVARAIDFEGAGTSSSSVIARLFAALEGDTAAPVIPPLPHLVPFPDKKPSLEAQVKALTNMVQQLVMLQTAAVQAQGASLPASLNTATAPVLPPPSQPSANAGGMAQEDIEMDADTPVVSDGNMQPTVKLPAELLAKITAEGAKFGKSLKTLFRTRAFRDKQANEAD